MLKSKSVKILIIGLILVAVLGIFLYKKLIIGSSSSVDKINNLKVSSENSIKKEVKKVLDFTSETCIPCKQMVPILNELKEEYKDNIEFVSIDINEFTEISNKYNIMYTPTLIFLDDEDKEISRYVGFIGKAKLKKVIESGGKVNGNT